LGLVVIRLDESAFFEKSPIISQLFCSVILP